MNFIKLNNDMVCKIFEYTNIHDNLKFGNKELYLQYMESGYYKLNEFIKQNNLNLKFHILDNRDWNYEYINLTYYLQYKKLMDEEYEWITPLPIESNIDWKSKYEFILENLFPSFMMDKNINHKNYISASTSYIPEEIGGFTHLTYLDLSCSGAINLAFIVPTQLCNLTNLIHLTISGMQLESLPECIGNLSKLRFLDLSYNSLTSLPKTFFQLGYLNYLDLRNNRFSDYPIEIDSLPSLGHIYF